MAHDSKHVRMLESQSRAVADAIASLVWIAFITRKPADRLLSAYLREHHEFGSRDRRAISQLVYGCFRWWGWTRQLLPKPFADALAEEITKPRDRNSPERVALPSKLTPWNSGEAWLPLMMAVVILDQLEQDQLTNFWASLTNLNNYREEFHDLRPLFAIRHFFELRHRKTDGLAMSQLVPDWVPAELPAGTDIDDLILWLQKRPPLWLRLQAMDTNAVLRELTTLDLNPSPHAKIPTAARIETGRQNLYLMPIYKEGRVEIQDIASQAVGYICDPRPGQRWWDACAGGGGKSLLLAQLMKGKGTVVASDNREAALEEAKKRARRAGFSNITTREWKGKALPPDKATFDGVLVDAPCSCSGTWRRNPAARWSLDRAEIDSHAARQLSLLTSAATALKPGGTLVYATCSMFEKENMAVIRAFLSVNPSFKLEPFTSPLTGAQTDGTLQILPKDADCDAMFIARLHASERREPTQAPFRNSTQERILH